MTPDQIATWAASGGSVTWGRGTLKIARLMQEAGLEPPTVSAMQGQPELSSAQMALLLGKSESAVKRATRKLRESGRLTRIGPDKGGYWKVIE